MTITQELEALFVEEASSTRFIAFPSYLFSGIRFTLYKYHKAVTFNFLLQKDNSILFSKTYFTNLQSFHTMFMDFHEAFLKKIAWEAAITIKNETKDYPSQIKKGIHFESPYFGELFIINTIDLSEHEKNNALISASMYGIEIPEYAFSIEKDLSFIAGLSIKDDSYIILRGDIPLYMLIEDIYVFSFKERLYKKQCLDDYQYIIDSHSLEL